MIDMNKIGNYIKEERKKAGLTQEEFAMRSGLGLRFVRELEQGKETVRMDKVNQALAMFGKEAVPGEKEEFWFGFDRGKSASRPLYMGKKLRGF